MDQTSYWIFRILFIVPAVIIGSTIHEYAHALLAWKQGDPTARAEGRLTLNPLAHIDPFGLLAMILAGFGWSKPVPVNEYYFDRKVLGTAIVSIAGPLSNFLVALVAAFFIRLLPDAGILTDFLIMFLFVNLSLAIFNLIPVPPLDGYRIARLIMPNSLRYYWEKLETYFPIILILLISPFSPIGNLVLTFISDLLTKIASILIGA